jgi:hypothetical protein
VELSPCIFKKYSLQKGVAGLTEVMNVVSPRVTPAMNKALVRPFMPKEIDLALSQMHSLKALEPNRFGVCFFQKHWATVGGAVR